MSARAIANRDWVRRRAITLRLEGKPYRAIGRRLAGRRRETDGQGGRYVMYFHHDQTAELQHWVPGQPTRTVIGKQIMWKVRAAMVELGITEDDWSPA